MARAGGIAAPPPPPAAGRRRQTAGQSAAGQSAAGRGTAERHGERLGGAGAHAGPGLVLAALLALAACDPLATSLPQRPAPRPAPPPPPGPLVRPPSPESRALAAYYQRVQDGLLARGLLRQGGGGPDTPFSARDLAEHFIRIAFFDEFVIEGGRVIKRETASRLRRWEGPIRMHVIFGPSIPPDQRHRDQAEIAAYAARLSALTGLPIRLVRSGGNFHVLFLNEDERRKAAPLIRGLVPGIDAPTIASMLDMGRETRCQVYAFTQGGGSRGAGGSADGSADGGGYRYTAAVAIIRAEHPDLLRTACIHEEIAQGLGLANDSPRARPSIFNDDEEFGRLTTMDELMLKILYDKRLKPGMTAREARPIVRQIAEELIGGSS